jgi:hypothetical protein
MYIDCFIIILILFYAHIVNNIMKYIIISVVALCIRIHNRSDNHSVRSFNAQLLNLIQFIYKYIFLPASS